MYNQKGQILLNVTLQTVKARCRMGYCIDVLNPNKLRLLFFSLSFLTKQRFTFEIFRHRDIDAQTVGYKNSEHFMWLSNGLRCAIFGLDFSV